MSIPPTASAMQYLLDVFHDYGIEHDILFNAIKSVCAFYQHNSYKLFQLFVLVLSH